MTKDKQIEYVGVDVDVTDLEKAIPLLVQPPCDSVRAEQLSDRSPADTSKQSAKGI